MSSTKTETLVRDWFAASPSAMAVAVEKGKILMRNELHGTHSYEYVHGKTSCWVCGESFDIKEVTRCPGFAGKHQRPDESIEGLILREEKLYGETVKRCRAIVLSRFSRPEEVTGAALAEIYHTHGCDASIVEDVLDCRIPESVHSEFVRLMDQERARSRAAQKVEIITAKHNL